VGGRKEADPPECFAAPRRRGAPVSGRRGRQITRGMTGEQGELPIPSLLQMDVIKPLAGEWGLMTPSGPILGLNEWRKITLRSKLQPVCSRAV